MWKNGAGIMMESATVSAVVFPSIGASMILRRVIGKEHPAPASAVLNKHFREGTVHHDGVRLGFSLAVRICFSCSA